MPRICNSSNLCFTLLQEFYTIPTNLASSFTLLTLLILLSPPLITTLSTILSTVHTNLIEDISVLLELNYASQFNASLNFLFL